MQSRDTTRRIPLRFRQAPERFVVDNRVSLLHDGAEAFPAMLGAIDAAREQILLEMYWFDSDTTGRRFAAALVHAAQRGVEVALMYDAVGSRDTDPVLFRQLEETGVRVVEYNPIALFKRRFRLDKLTRRDHRKLLVVDAEVGFTGGINLADQWAPTSEGGGGWRDDVVRIEGPVVADLVNAFHRAWREQDGPPLGRPVPSKDAVPGTRQLVRVLTESVRRRQIVRAYVHNIYRAHRRIWIANSYFLPDPVVVRALRRAARHGVEVRVIVPGKSDVEVARHASRAAWGRLMRRGVRIHEWQGPMMHSKTAVIDGIWSTVGTFNFDNQSLRSNLEINVAVRDAEFGALMEASFERDLAQSREVDPKAFGERPIRDRILEVIGYRLRKIL